MWVLRRACEGRRATASFGLPRRLSTAHSGAFCFRQPACRRRAMAGAMTVHCGIHLPQALQTALSCVANAALLIPSFHDALQTALSWCCGIAVVNFMGSWVISTVFFVRKLLPVCVNGQPSWRSHLARMHRKGAADTQPQCIGLMDKTPRAVLLRRHEQRQV